MKVYQDYLIDEMAFFLRLYILVDISVPIQREISCFLTLAAHFSHLSLLLPAENLLLLPYWDFFSPKSDISGIFCEHKYSALW